MRILAGWFVACAVGWAAVYGIGLALIYYPRVTVAVAVFLVGCAAVFCEWRDERALSERDGRLAASVRSLNGVPRLLGRPDRDPLKAEETGAHRNGGRS